MRRFDVRIRMVAIAFDHAKNSHLRTSTEPVGEERIRKSGLEQHTALRLQSLSVVRGMNEK